MKEKLIGTPFKYGECDADVAPGGGLAYYDTVLDITWLVDANAGAGLIFDDRFSTTDGRMTWANANSWAASLSVGGFMDWRLPTALNSDGSGPCSGFNCTGSEMGHLFYNELGGTAFSSIGTTNNSNFDLFMNVQSNFYWSGLEFAPDPPSRGTSPSSTAPSSRAARSAICSHGLFTMVMSPRRYPSSPVLLSWALV